MQTALGITPEHNATIKSSEVCGTCHTVHLPVRQPARSGRPSSRRTCPSRRRPAGSGGHHPYLRADDLSGMGVQRLPHRHHPRRDGPLPHGAGSLAQSCQDCHMPSKTADGKPMRSKIASIQEYSNFPEAENNLGPEDIDLPVRDGFAAHTLVGLNVFLIKIAQQFPDVLGIPTPDPMMGTRGVDPLVRTEQAMLDLASHRHRGGGRDRRLDHRRHAAGDRDRAQRDRPQAALRRRLPPRLRRVPGAGPARQHALGLRPHQRGRRPGRPVRQSARRRVLVDGRLHVPHPAAGAAAPAALPAHHRPGPGPDLSGAGVDPAAQRHGRDVRPGHARRRAS